MNWWLGCALCVMSPCLGQGDLYGLPPIEQGLAGSSLTNSSEGSSALPAPSKPGTGMQVTLYHDNSSLGTGLTSSGVRLYGTHHRYTFAVDWSRAGFDEHTSQRIRLGLSIPIPNHRLGCRWVLEQWFRTDNGRPFRMYPELAIWSHYTGTLNYAFSIGNPTGVKWVDTKLKTDPVFRAELSKAIVDQLTLYFGWRSSGTETHWSVSAEWYVSDDLILVIGASSGGSWFSFGSLWQLGRIGIHVGSELQEQLGWDIGTGLSWQF